FHAMGSPCEILLACSDHHSPAIVQRLELELQRLEAKYSRFQSSSLLSAINQSAGSGKSVSVDEETERLLDYADTCFKESSGLFDITSGSLKKIWNYHDLEDRQVLPDEAAIRKALEKVGWEKVERKPGEILLPFMGMEIDFGGIVKEYAADCVAGLADKLGAGPGMVELGGDIRLFDTDKSRSWQVGIRDPHDASRPAATVRLQQGGLATSGDYERYSVIQGRRYSHILNPLTGWPVEGFSSVSVLADQCVVAGSAASIAVMKGDEGVAWLKELGLPYLCIDQAGQVSGTMT
ncbi:MAG: FAD:protein FMN transferase, partial [Gammaproteobacteria bacterium]